MYVHTYRSVAIVVLALYSRTRTKEFAYFVYVGADLHIRTYMYSYLSIQHYSKSANFKVLVQRTESLRVYTGLHKQDVN